MLSVDASGVVPVGVRPPPPLRGSSPCEAGQFCHPHGEKRVVTPPPHGEQKRRYVPAQFMGQSEKSVAFLPPVSSTMPSYTISNRTKKLFIYIRDISLLHRFPQPVFHTLYTKQSYPSVNSDSLMLYPNSGQSAYRSPSLKCFVMSPNLLNPIRYSKTSAFICIYRDILRILHLVIYMHIQHQETSKLLITSNAHNC